ncbi:MAG: UDP-N-acetylmuramoyl-L-alanyl-D-glutamate--2,6-diaminopimelate ligase [Cyanobacteria bacterium]|nr:UDP-N-acetylmuramoyl-L-alanyl-D-glutamate--2,6-diaminopimelate ligase [Cyanobacteriota bacterium]MDA1020493.1 UDP-N-acetylmuramoyl-L-alanyl-D-glutamate--2,6-diaminopimelate ligase [Cyanobacteriota bacterium]
MKDLGQYTDIHYDSRQVSPGSIFVAIIGDDVDGHDYIKAAINKGAVLIIAEKQITVPEGIELCVVEDSRQELARLSSDFYGKPDQTIDLIAVTGTNGKTTMTHLLQELLPKTALLGTMGLKTSAKADYDDLGNTTPQSKEIYRILADLVNHNFKYLAMEVSSHALEQKRVAGLQYKAAVITNLTQDHLDYHVTMDNYFEAKAKLFKQVSEYVLLNADDEYYERFKNKLGSLTSFSFALNADADYQAIDIRPVSKHSFDVQVAQKKVATARNARVAFGDNSDFQNKSIEYNAAGMSYTVVAKGNRLGEVALQLNGQFNVYNSLAAIAVALEEGIKFEDIQKQLAKIPPVAGRFEVIQTETSPTCVVDYAHSPDGLLNVLQGARGLVDHANDSRLICLFGCGGDRDITKRPKMGTIAYDLADYIYVTSDNPRSEDPDQIIADILTGIPDLNKVKVIADRRQAIQAAVAEARQGDVLVVAGKGHEDYQILRTETIHFDDREEVRKGIGMCS